MSILFPKNRPLMLDEQGFSLLELTLVFLVAGFLFVPVYTMLTSIDKLQPSERRFEIIQKALAEHFRVTGTMPCPAPPGLDATNNAAAYVGVCGAGPVMVGAVPIRNLREAIGGRCEDDTDGFALANEVAGTTQDALYSFKDMLTGISALYNPAVNQMSTRAKDADCIPYDYIVDDNGYKFIYAVTAAATVPGFDVFNRAVGAIAVTDSAGNPATTDGQIYVLLSVGPDGKGGVLKSGAASGVACNGTLGLDNQNCDGDAAFVDAPYSDLVGAGHYDDMIDFGLSSFMTEESFWRWGANGAAGRDLVLNNNTRLVVGPEDAAFPPDADDALVVNDGQFSGGDTIVVNGGTWKPVLELDQNNNPVNPPKIIADEQLNSGAVNSPAYCYCGAGGTSALTSTCRNECANR